MNPRPFLSILIPTRNRAKYLPYAIQSALNLDAADIEVLVSDNHSSDNTSEVLASFSDPRLRTFRPEKPLPMHANWEYLLSQARGEWLCVLGDDDAMMLHCVRHLKFISAKFPEAEAIVTPRAYYYWDGVQDTYGNRAVSVSFSDIEAWVDSKKAMSRCLSGDIAYIELPQIYSGGFQKKSLVQRIKRAQTGKYFKGVLPDSYSALAASMHTFRYLKIGIPLTWVGTSPHSKSPGTQNRIKDRDAEFFGMHNDDDLVYCSALGQPEELTSAELFYECYLSSMPSGHYSMMSNSQLKKIFLNSAMLFFDKKKPDLVLKLSRRWGFSFPSRFSPRLTLLRLRRFCIRRAQKSRHALETAFRKLNGTYREPLAFYSSSHQLYPNILSAERQLNVMYSKWMER